MKFFVLDCSATLAVIMPDENKTPEGLAVQSVLNKDTPTFVPALWMSEVSNVIISKANSGKIPRFDLLTTWAEAEGLFPTVDKAEMFRVPTIIVLAKQHRLTTYDATYLELAMRHGATLITLDKALRAAAVAEGLSVAP